MLDLNIQERKLNIIEELINIDDRYILQEIEDILNSYNKDFRRFSQQELIERAKQSDDDIINGRVFSIDEVKEILNSW